MRIKTLLEYYFLKEKRKTPIFRIINTALLMLFLTYLPLSANFAYSKHSIIKLNANTITVGELISNIENQTDYLVLFRNREVDMEQTVDLSSKSGEIAMFLKKAFENTDIAYEFENKYIVLTKKGEQTLLTKTTNQAERRISGVVKDASGETIIGANVIVKGSSSGTITDVNGRYSLNVPEGATLQFSYIGYNTVEVKIEKQNNINITMNEDSQALDEVVVIGYGTQKKVNLTGAVSSVKGDVFENRPIGAVGTGLQGFLPGVTITSPSGQPGSTGMNITVRGVNTINSQTNPLILIDGVAGGDLNLVNPDDIESVTVLKDAASSAIYGARAANGVILVTTKKGKTEGRTSLSYSGNFGVQTPTSLPEMVNGRQFMVLENEARNARGVAIPYSEEAFMKYDSQNFPNDYSNTDWIKETFKDFSTQQSHNVNLSGKSNNSSYYMSYGFLNQDGLIIDDAYNSRRHNLRLRLNTNVFDRLKIDGNVSFIDFYKTDAGGSGTGGVFRLVQRVSPLLPVMWQLPTEGGGFMDSPYWSYGSVGNPVRVAQESGYSRNQSRTFNGNFNATLDIMDGLFANGQYSYNYYTRDVKNWSPTQPRFLADGTPHAANDNVLNSISESHRSILTQTLNTTLNYQKTISKHTFNVLAGFSQEWAYLPTLSASRKKILLDGIEVIDAGTEDIINSGTAEHWALRSYFGRINYDFMEKYLFEANVRMDGTSRFSKDNRWGVFPSFSAGWKFSEEAFMEWTKPALTIGKIRASWGELGNQNISSNYYPYLTAIERQTKSYPIGNKENVGFKQYSLANEDIKWETIRMLNIGVDVQMFNNRLDMSFDWFKKNNINALLKPIYPTVIGISASANLPLENIGSIENKGWEFQIGWRDQIQQVKYGFSANVSDTKNKITDMGKSAPSLGNYLRRVGDPINAYYGYMTDGLAQVGDFGSYNEATKKYEEPKFAVISSYANIIQPGDIIYRDISGEDGTPDGKIDEYDKVVFGNPFPRYSFSFRGYAEWNNFDFSFFLQGIGKVNGYLQDEARHAFLNDYSVPKTAHLDRWTPNNTNATYPRLYYQPSHNIVFSNYWMENAAYLRLKNIQLGYTIPRMITQKSMIDKLKVYVSIDNLLTFTNYFGGFDPEVVETSGDSYPQVKTFSFGVQLVF